MEILLSAGIGFLVGVIIGGWAYFYKGYIKGYNDRKIKEYKWRNDELLEWFNNGEHHYMKVVYEKITGDKNITEINVKKIKRFLDIDIPNIIPVRTMKNTYSKIEDNLINYKEIISKWVIKYQ